MISNALHRIIVRVIIALFTLVMFSCAEEQNQTVDEQYLDSQEYNSFKENSEKERTKRADQNDDLGQQLSAFVECEVSELPLPTTIEWDNIQSLAKDSECVQEWIKSEISFIGKQDRPNITIGWFLVEYQSAYRDAEIIVATFVDEQIRSFQTVGLFEKVPAREINTTVSVDWKGDGIYIRSETNRDINYPLDQENSIVASYKIDANGGISEL